MKVPLRTEPTTNGFIAYVGQSFLYAVKRTYVDGKTKTVAIVNPSMNTRTLAYIISATEVFEGRSHRWPNQ